MQNICMPHVTMRGKRIATLQERITAVVGISESQVEGEKKGFQESRYQKREKMAVLQVRSFHIKLILTKTMGRLKACSGNTEGYPSVPKHCRFILKGGLNYVADNYHHGIYNPFL